MLFRRFRWLSRTSNTTQHAQNVELSDLMPQDFDLTNATALSEYHNITKFTVESASLENNISDKGDVLSTLCQELKVEFDKNNIKSVSDVLKRTSLPELSQIVENPTDTNEVYCFKMTPIILKIFFPQLYNAISVARDRSNYEETPELIQYRLTLINYLLQQRKEWHEPLTSPYQLPSPSSSSSPTSQNLLIAEAHSDHRTRTFVSQQLTTGELIHQKLFLEIFYFNNEQELLDHINDLSVDMKKFEQLTPSAKMDFLIPYAFKNKFAQGFSAEQTPLSDSPLSSLLIECKVGNKKIVALDNELLSTAALQRSLGIPASEAKKLRILLFNQYAYQIIKAMNLSDQYIVIVGEAHATCESSDIAGLDTLLGLPANRLNSTGNKLEIYQGNSRYDETEAASFIKIVEEKLKEKINSEIKTKRRRNCVIL